MDTKQKSFIEELRSLSESTKKKVLFGAAGVSMLIVIYLWGAYFNTIVPSAVSIDAGQTAAITTTAETGGPGILGLFANTAGLLWQNIGSSVRGAASALKNPKKYNISPK